MLKQYRAAVVGVICMMAAIVVTGLISLKDEQPTEDTDQVMLMEQSTSADKEQLTENPVLSLAGGTDVLARSADVSADTEETQPAGEENTEEVQTPAADGEAMPESDVEEMTEEAEPETAAEASEFDGYVLPVVDVYLNIRETPSTDATIVGKLYVGSMAQIVEEQGEWTKISSGSVEGYLNND